jgi:SAM-dependent methyltransferase
VCCYDPTSGWRPTREATAERDIQNVHFQLCNVMKEDDSKLGAFDVILCKGVLHHLSDPAHGLCNLVYHLTDDGILFLYIYGWHGGRERARRKQIVSLLLGNGNKEPKNFERCIRLVKDLGFDSFEYGWNLDYDDEESVNALIVAKEESGEVLLTARIIQVLGQFVLRIMPRDITLENNLSECQT